MGDEPGQTGTRRKHPVHIIAVACVLSHGVPPVDGEQCPARTERSNAKVQDVTEIPVTELPGDMSVQR